MPRGRRVFTPATKRPSSSAAAKGAFCRRRAIAAATRAASGSSPYARKIRRSSGSLQLFTISAAVTRRSGSERISSAPRARKLKPRSSSASWTRASSRRTGTCRGASSFVACAERRTPLDPEVPEVALDFALDAGELAAPASGLPDLEVIGVSDDDRFSGERRVLAEVGRDDDAALRIRVRLMRARQHEVAEPRDRGLGAGPLADLHVERGPLRGRKDGKAFAYPTCHDRSFFEAGPELGRDGEPTLLVQ